MRLQDYLSERELTFASFAARIGRSRQAVERYAKGGRIPDRETMPLIVEATEGRVTANDFYAPSAAPTEDRAA